MEQLVGTSAFVGGMRETNPGVVTRANVFGFDFDQLDERGVVDHVFGELERGRGGWMITPNLHILRQATRDEEVAQLVRTASLVIMDGAPVEWAGRVSRRSSVGRTPGSTVFWSLCESAARRGRSVLLMGGRAGSAEMAAAKLAELHPGISVSAHFPPFGFESDPQAMASIRDAVRHHDGGLVFVGLGCPKQERLMVDLSREFPSAWFFGVGAAIDFASGQLRRAPMWMQRSGLEWAHRLATEPRRLARRYLVEDLPFSSMLLTWAIAERVSAVRSRRTSAPPTAPTTWDSPMRRRMRLRARPLRLGLSRAPLPDRRPALRAPGPTRSTRSRRW